MSARLLACARMLASRMLDRRLPGTPQLGRPCRWQLCRSAAAAPHLRLHMQATDARLPSATSRSWQQGTVFASWGRPATAAAGKAAAGRSLGAATARCSATADQRQQASTEADVPARPADQAVVGSSAAGDAEQQAVDALADWIRAIEPQPAQLAPRRIPGRGGGWGLVAQQPVKKGQLLVRVPAHATMSAASASDCEIMGPIAAGLNDWQALSLHLLVERAKGSDSFWAPFIARLPSQADHPLLWDAEQRDWLRGSPMARTLADRLQQIDEDTEAVQQAVQLAARRKRGSASDTAADNLHGRPLQELVSHGSMAWAAATALSRGFNLRRQDFDDNGSGGEEDWQQWDNATTLLVPWVDLLNHSSDAGEESCLRGGGRTASLAAHCDYAAGEEVFDSYSPWLSPQDLLMNYGFHDPANDNHQATLLFDPTTAAAAGGASSDLLNPATAHSSMDMVVGPEGPDETALTWTRAVLSGKEAVFAFGWDPEAGGAGDFDPAIARALGELSEPTDRDLEGRILDALLAAHDAQLAGYPSTAEQDAAAAADETVPWLERQVRATLATEKRALAGSRAAVARWRAALAAGTPLPLVYAS